jgi:hypothetical protein
MVSGSREAGRVKLAGLPIRAVDAGRALVEKLRGHAVDPGWLPTSGLLGEALGGERAEHLRQLEGLQAAADAYRDAEATFLREDREHAAALRSYVREGGDPPADERTRLADREARLAALREDLEARVVVLAAHVERVVGLLRDREHDLLADLRAQLEPARAKRREAERLLAEAKGEEWHLAQLGRWVQQTSQDGPLGRQPAPIPSPPPAQFSEAMVRAALERPWYAHQDAVEPVSWQALGAETAPADATAGGDPTGQVSGLEEHGSQEAAA